MNSMANSFQPAVLCCVLHCNRDHLENYTSDYTVQILMGYCVVYIFVQTFMIPGTVFMSLLTGPFLVSSRV
ncbi:hypothetical protein Pint_03462 [Pistacia integerrima]|uniref:Uncharacterized protein n=1 Tax=Pistacia integerrima TaxID=434235 RepID=A0ACC0ZLH0_9ROSI|nr:hypothetical protein Pint_03462 [Pistacia integerrima]